MIAVRKREVDGFISLLSLTAAAFLFKTIHSAFNEPFICVMSNPTDINQPYVVPAGCFFHYAGTLDDPRDLP